MHVGVRMCAKWLSLLSAPSCLSASLPASVAGCPPRGLRLLSPSGTSPSVLALALALAALSLQVSA